MSDGPPGSNQSHRHNYRVFVVRQIVAKGLHQWLLNGIEQHDFMIANECDNLARLPQSDDCVNDLLGIRSAIDVVLEENECVIYWLNQLKQLFQFVAATMNISDGDGAS